VGLENSRNSPFQGLKKWEIGKHFDTGQQYTVKALSIVFQGTGKFERYIREMIVPENH
jgi:hypothetical protein